MAAGRGRVAERQVLTDPRAIRALAHPARLAVLDALQQRAELTATECAEVAGLSPSAMSYHLRALEKYGFVQRAERSGDGREHPWQLTHREWRLDVAGNAAATESSKAALATIFGRLQADLATWVQRENHAPKAWADTGLIRSHQLWLTPAEARRFNDAVDAMVAKVIDRTEEEHPAGARQVRIGLIVAPSVEV